MKSTLRGGLDAQPRFSFLLARQDSPGETVQGWKAVPGEERATRPDLPWTAWVALGETSSALGLFAPLHHRDCNLPAS